MNPCPLGPLLGIEQATGIEFHRRWNVETDFRYLHSANHEHPMKSPLLVLRLFAFMCFFTSVFVVEAKPCNGSFMINLLKADGTVSYVYWGSGGYSSTLIIPVTLLSGDTLLISHLQGGDCGGQTGIRVRRSAFPDTASSTSPVIFGFVEGQTNLKLTQQGSYYLTHMGTDNFLEFLRIAITADEEPVPFPVGLQFTKENASQYYFPESYPILAFVPELDTCSGPCATAYLLNGQFVRMQALSSGMAQEGGNVVVRYAPDGESLDFGTPATTIPLVGSEGYQFSEDGTYLLSVEGPLFTATGYAYIRISHLPTPRVDMSLTVERADGSTEGVTYALPNGSQLHPNIELGLGDSLRIDHHEITEPCGSIRLVAYQSPNWGPAYSNPPVVSDTPSTTAGVRMASPGSYRLRHITDCGIPTSQAYLTINAPVPQLDLVVSVQRSDGTEDEVFRGDTITVPTPELEVEIQPGDTIQLHFEETGWCGSSKYFRVYKNTEHESDPAFDYNLTWGMSPGSFSLTTSGEFLIRLNGSACYATQDVRLHVTGVPIIGTDLRLEQLQQDGSAMPLVYVAAGDPMAFVPAYLSAGDSIYISGVPNGTLCDNIRLHVFRSDGDTATSFDSAIFNGYLPTTGLVVRETGTLLVRLLDLCGVVASSAHVTLSSDISTTVAPESRSTSSIRYVDRSLQIDSKSGGLLLVHNAAGQLIQETVLAKGRSHHSIPFKTGAFGIYVATVRTSDHIELLRFAVY